MKKNHRFKPYTPIYKALNKICIGYVEDLNKYIELEHNEINVTLLNDILENGVSKKELKHFPLNEFFEKGFIEKTDVNVNPNRRNELYLNYLLGKNDLNIAINKSILVFGAGAGGSTLVYLLAQMGFKHITVVDFDYVEESDIYRVMTFDTCDIGTTKVDSLKEKIKKNFKIDINSYTLNLLDYEELYLIINKINPDFIVKACDPKGVFIKNLNAICFKKNIPFIMMAYSYELIKIGPLYVPKITSCSESFSNFAIDMFGEHYKTEYFERMFSEHLFHPSISFNINILSSLILKEILFFLLEKFDYCQTIGRLIIFNPLLIQTNSFFVQCKEDCKICKDA